MLSLSITLFLHCCRRSHRRGCRRSSCCRSGTRSIVGTSCDTSIAITQEDIPIPNAPSGVALRIRQEHISVSDSSEGGLSFTRIQEDISISDRAESCFAVAVDEEHVTVLNCSSGLIPIRIADRYCSRLSNCCAVPCRAEIREANDRFGSKKLHSVQQPNRGPSL